jgi:hypothetical protein
MSEGLVSSSAGASSQSVQRQVRVQLTSKQEDIALPENTGPILVPTGEVILRQDSNSHESVFVTIL